MKLLTKAIISKLEKTRYDKEKPVPNDAPVLARFFNPSGSGTWSVLEGEKLPNNDWRFFGVVDIGQDKEYGYFNLSQLQDFKGQFGLGIERDRNFKGTRASLDKEYGFRSFTRSKEIQEELKNKKRTIPERSYLVPTADERKDKVLRDIRDDMNEQIISPDEAQKRIIKRLKELRKESSKEDKSLSKELMKVDSLIKQKKEPTNISKADRKAFIQSIDVIKDIESDRLSKDDKYYLSRLRAALKQGIDKTDSLTVGQLEKVNEAAEGLTESGGTQRMSSEGARILLPHAEKLMAENALVKLKKNTVVREIKPKTKKDKPEDGKQYRITGKPDDPSIERGDSWKESEVKDKSKSYVFKEMLETYQKNEDNNLHSENAKLLADAFGTPAQQKKMDAILKRHLKSSTGISGEDYKWRTKNIDPLYKDLLNARDLEKSINKETKSIDPIYTNLSKEIQEELEEKKKQASSIAKQLPLMVDLDNKKEVNSATVAGVPVNNSKKDKTPTQVETLLNRIASWRKKNDLGDSKVNQKNYVLDKAFTKIKTDTELTIKQLRQVEGEKKEDARNLIQLLENTLYGKGKKKLPKEKPVDNNMPDLSANNFKTKTKGNYPHRVAWLQSNGSWVSVDLNNRTMTTSLELKNVLKAGDMTEKEINKSLSWMQIEDIRSRPNGTFRILKESSEPPKDINYMSFGKNDLKVTKNGFAVFENRNHKKHYGADGQERAMKYKRSNYKYPRANNRYSIWNSRKRSSQGQVGFKILRKKK
tara:strand:- start:3325 stop:5604 length:2280 start_codon:yes stop_codon:yes gene_type:complete